MGKMHASLISDKLFYAGIPFPHLNIRFVHEVNTLVNDMLFYQVIQAVYKQKPTKSSFFVV